MSRRFFPLYDALRGVAAMMVLTYHVALVTGHVGEGAFGRVAATFGSLGVELFFVISGFLLYRPFARAAAESRPAPALGTFLLRRALRIIPAYYVVLTILAIYPGIHGPFSADFWRYYGFLQLYDRETIVQGLPVAWSLGVEVTFYLALPLWAVVFRRAALRAELAALALAGVAGAALQVLSVDHDALYVVSRTLLGQAPYFAIGMALALLSVAGDRRVAAGWCWAAAAAAGAVLAIQVPAGGIAGLLRQDALLGSSGVALRIVVSLAFVGLAVLPATFGERAGGWPRRFLAWRPAAWVGMVSYSVYLWHLPVAEVLALHHAPGQFDATGLDLARRVDVLMVPLVWYMTATFTLLLAWATWRWVERPCIALGHAASGAYPSGKADGAKNQHSTA